MPRTHEEEQGIISTFFLYSLAYNYNCLNCDKSYNHAMHVYGRSN